MNKDRRVQRTRDMLQQAYLRLISSYEEHEITVKMITDEANINRATFYAHFTNKADFLEEMLYELLAGFENAILAAFKHKDKINIAKLTPTTEIMFDYIEAHKQDFYALSMGHAAFEKRLEQLFHHLFTKKIYIQTSSAIGEINYDIFIHYQTKATLSLLFYWIQSNFSHSKEYMMKQLTILSNTKITSLKRMD